MDEIPVTVPPAPVEGEVGLTDDQRRKRQVADELAEYGLVEAPDPIRSWAMRITARSPMTPMRSSA